MRKPALHVLALCSIGALLAACGGDDPDPPTSEQPGEFEVGPFVANEPAALSILSTSGCLLDTECEAGTHCFQGVCSTECSGDADCASGEVCGDRARCVASGSNKSVDGGGQSGGDDVLPGYAFEELPARQQRVPEGTQSLQLRATLNQPAPEGGLRYRIETEPPSGPVVVARTAGGSTEVVFEVPVPEVDDDAYPIEVAVVSSAGVIRATMVTPATAAGQYAGEASISTLGNMNVPLAFWVVTDPPQASLDEAERAWLLLPIGPNDIFSPRAAFGEADSPWMASELEYDDFVERWVGRFDNAFRFPSSSALPEYDAEQVGRTMRFEIEQFGDDRIIGQFVDRWTGLYETRTLEGLSQLAVVRFEGELEAVRVGAAPSPADVTAPSPAPADSQPLPRPALDLCEDANFDIAPIRVEDVSFGCGDITNAREFEFASDEDRAACAIAVVETALSGETTGGRIEAFLSGGGVPGGQSFADFMEDCAAGEGGFCRPTASVLCGRQLAAFAFAVPEEEVATSPQLVLSFQNATREAFLGRQLGAFQTDSTTRLEWLKASDYPAIVTSAVQSHTANLLDGWVENVLDVHLDVLGGQLDTAGLAVLSRQPRGDDAVAARQQLLLEMSQSWRGSMDTLTVATQRWHSIYQRDGDREDAADEVATRMFDLYVAAGVLANLNIEAGVGYANATFGGGFGQLVRASRLLRLPYSALIYARDAEVVVSTSLDPESGADSILRERREAADAELLAADEAVNTIITAADERALDEADLRNRLNNEIEDQRAYLVDLCGLPSGCTVAEYGEDDACEVRVAAGECGFIVDRFTRDFADFGGTQQNVSEAGRELMSVRDAALEFSIAEEELRAHLAEVQRAIATTDAFAGSVVEWDQRRRDGLSEIQTIADEAAAEADTVVAELMDSISERARQRSALISDRRAAVLGWSQIRVAGAQSDYRQLVAATALEQSAAGRRESAQTVSEMASAVSDGFPTTVGLSSDPFSPARMAVLLAGAGVSAGLRFSALSNESSAARIRNVQERDRALRDAELTRLEQEGDIDDQAALDEITLLAEQSQARATALELEQWQVNRLINSVRDQVQSDLAFGRDLAELRDRRDDVATLIGQTSALEIRVIQAEYDIQRRVNQYLQIVQTGELQAARLADLETQRESVNLLLGSPSVVFSRARELERAERRLNRAKDALMNWLVAMEYIAVRPFMDQRLQILLANNTSQLEAIAAEMRRLESVCGGLTNEETSEVSVVELLDLESPVVDGAGVAYSSGERFRAVLARGAIPIDKRVRYRADQNVGSIISRDDILAATFTLSLDDFANLVATCNARALTVEVQLVGEGLGEGRPTINLLYDGNSQLRSCQPGIEDYVAQFGPDSTAYGEITTFETPGRSVAPVAGINEFRENSVNQSLAGLPLSAAYTVLIDPNLGENRDIDWDSLEDIRLRVGYIYQDVFPVGACE